MKPEQQRIAIAEAHGITQVVEVVEAWKPSPFNVRLEGVRDWIRIDVPDYLNDPNAMRNVILSQITNSGGDFIANLRTACGVDHEYVCMALIMASPNQLAEAFLRTIGKWVES